MSFSAGTGSGRCQAQPDSTGQTLTNLNIPMGPRPLYIPTGYSNSSPEAYVISSAVNQLVQQ